MTTECRIYAQGTTPPAFAACSGPGDTHRPATVLVDGPYTFEVRGTDVSLNTSTASRSFEVNAVVCAQVQTTLAADQATLRQATSTLAAANAALSSAEGAVAKATTALRKAKAKLKKAKQSGTAAQVQKAKARSRRRTPR